jgi:hypothetical protein
MGFVWTNSVAVGAYITAAALNEMRTNIQTNRTALSMGAYGYTHVIAAGNIDYSIDWSETRTALDLAKDNNYCHTNYATNYNSDLGTNRVGINTSVQTGVQSSNNVSEDSHCSVDYGGEFSAYNVGTNAAVNGSYDGTINSGDNSAGGCSGVCTIYNSALQVADHSPHDSGFYDNVMTDYLTTENSTYRVSAQTTDKAGNDGVHNAYVYHGGGGPG